MVTPFTEDGKADTGALQNLTDLLIKRGINCLYPCGTTGEMVHLTCEERETIGETVVRAAAGRGTVFLHCGAMREEETRRLLAHAVSCGADGAGIVTPMFLGVNEEEMEAYYDTMAGSVPADFPIYLYNIPQCAGNDLKPEAARRLREKHPNIIGIKYSYPDMLRTLDYLDIPDFDVLHGCDKLFASLLLMGCSGTVSGVAGVFPEPFAAVYEAWKKQDLQAMYRWQKICVKFCDLLRCGSNMAYFKEALRMRGLPVGGMRSPQKDLKKQEVLKLEEQLQALCEESGIQRYIGNQRCV